MGEGFQISFMSHKSLSKHPIKNQHDASDVFTWKQDHNIKASNVSYGMKIIAGH